MMTSDKHNNSQQAEKIDFNDEFKAAFSLIQKASGHVFVTGKAGTGKSTLLRYIWENIEKKAVLLAPTGVAAINIGGQTIHSFFNFPPSFIQKSNIHRSKKAGIIKNLDAIIIDEISMVRADMMDGIDYALRINRNEMEKPFGGIQLICFGDLFQLPPVVEKEVRDVLYTRYETPYFFSAQAFKGLDIKFVELTKHYRQSDREFVALLNRVRDKKHADKDLKVMNKRVLARPGQNNNAIILTATNHTANTINQSRLDSLRGKKYVYEASVSGKFDKSAYPTDSVINLKQGAQIILIKNDPNKRWVNGTIAKAAKVTEDAIQVDIDGEIHDIAKTKWQKIEYTYNKETDKIEEKVIGTFAQYPIKLAWAITIHKSQGQTFDKAVIDLGAGAFAHGQVYVALSRCTGLEGITLKRPIYDTDIIFDERIYEFMNQREKLKNKT